jgi:putative heme iron utilization protein
MNPTELRDFIRVHRQLTLAVSQADVPFTAMSAYVPEPDLRSVLIHLSNLSAHKRMLANNPKCSLLIAEPDDGRAEVMSLARVTLQGVATTIDKASDDYAQAKARFMARLPASAVMFGLPDFDLIRITITDGRYIAGFGKAFPFTAEDLAADVR